ncbi:MAG TPA: PilZ domain-containing protein [Terriglobales bacterium]|nr:PilZ domain-containing protein [Terriglobales bacterium]
MTLSSMVVSRDFQEVSVLECILGSLRIVVDIESEPERARLKLAKSKIDALIIDCDLNGAAGVLKGLQDGAFANAVPLIIVSGSSGRKHLESKGASFIFEKPISVEQAVHTLSAARNMILDGRLRYHRETLDVPVTLAYTVRNRQRAHLMNLSQGGIGVRMQGPQRTVGPVKVAFTLPGTKQTMKFLGEVAWTDKQGNAGIRFVETSAATKRQLQLWLERQYFTH